MNKQTIIDSLIQNYTSFITEINELTATKLQFSNGQKWTAGQQLQHIVLCVKPLVQVFSMDKSMIAQNFGIADKPGRSYDVLLGEYLEKLNEGGKAPDRFVPENVLAEQRTGLSESLGQLINLLCSKIENFSEEDLDQLCIPHPLLGKLTLREMLCNAIYHVEHHGNQVKQNLDR